ncbi:LuxR C-terminal-related transcriptional regulator [Streptomyces sp. NPDC046716]|uniref:LuxR C-terminal-related transcriptional regulator n=1 Tax=Streptomyces sp. NPDC046716 TaxID=3157093 RepID=UPI0033E3FF2A
MRYGVLAVCAADPQIKVVSVGVVSAVSDLLWEFRPDVLICVSSEGGEIGRVADSVARAVGDCAVLVVTNETNFKTSLSSFHCPAGGILSGRSLDKHLGWAVRASAAGSFAASPDVLAWMAENRSGAGAGRPSERQSRLLVDGLTPREREIVALVVGEFSNGEIARKLHVTSATVKGHLHSAYAKLGVRGRVGAARVWWEADAPVAPARVMTGTP